LFEDLLHLSSCKFYVLVNLSLVYFVKFGDSEDGDKSEDDECHAVECGSQIREHPQEEAKLHGVHEVLHQEQTTELTDGVCAALYNNVCGLVYFSLGYGDVDVKILLERVSVSGLLNGLDDFLIDAKADGDCEGSEREVGSHREHGKQGQR